MLVLLPPSEGKGDGAEGAAPVDPEALALADVLGPQRERLLDALVGLCRDTPERAREVLGLSQGLAGEVPRNAGLRTAPAAPAAEIYTGVLYENLGLATLGRAARRRAGTSLLVFSGLWGAVRPGDRIPHYRCSMGVSLPGIGGLAAAWRPLMERALPAAAGDGLVLDLRSSAYASAWKPKGVLAERTATVRVLQERRAADGSVKRTVVSHFNKATKGRMLRALLEAGAEPRKPGDLAGLLGELGWTVESGPSGRIDVIVSEL
ncbi:hypothetical protein BIV57_15845 [Mangrovactinospora gilvigrisea]|uniref:Peroxide stress protein YaaA n=1 Tax=Mangrovactinospora gilvigrisea TaxID=1428644 RepID=A0A1J7BCZ2_9ACTN|nr:peroxide stress protein YaaA [Mangrovactinospora gilvigrisea]OIV36518.1 hypothetical protein BIV57_15845 [Mangrovactinospora gilvigrisea]